MKSLKFQKVLAAGAVALAMFASCDDNDGGGKGVERVTDDLHVAFASGTESDSYTYVQGVTDITKGEISSQKGYSLESSRTARIFVSEDAGTLWSLNYTVGTVEKLTYNGGDKYTKIKTFDASIPLGVKALRFTRIDDNIGSLHYIAATAEYENESDPDTYKGHKMIATVGLLDLETMTLKEGYNKEITVAMDAALAKQGYYIGRIDCPVLSNGKLYYGCSVSKFNPSTATNEVTDKTFTLVIDYSDLSKASVIYTDKVQGATNGYRTPTQWKNESGEILQVVSGKSKTTGEDEVHIVKVKGGKYDETFDFNLSKLLNKPATSNGWFYVGNNIGYVIYQDLTTESKQIGVNPQGKPSYSCDWRLARIDLRNNKAIDLNVPAGLWLQQYQNSVVKDGYFYIALSPVSKEGNIYMFDIDSDSKDAKLGAKIVGTGLEQYYIGIY